MESSKTRELGNQAIMGAGANPRKRSNEKGGGYGAEGYKNRRRKLRHEFLRKEEGSSQQTIPLLRTLPVMEQEKSGEELLIPPREQDPKQHLSGSNLWYNQR